VTIFHVMAIVLLTHFGVNGAKLLLALYAIDFGASPLQVGLTFSLFSILPAIFALTAGRWIDRIGGRVPLAIGCAGVGIAISMVCIAPALWVLYPISAAIGLCFMIYQVAGQSLVGILGGPGDRTRNFSYYALAVALAAMLGRFGTGAAIDLIGHRGAALMLALGPVLALAIAWSLRRRTPASGSTTPRPPRASAMDLWQQPPLRRALIAGAIVESGNELFTLFVPLYGSSLGLSATFIGLLLGVFSGASFVVRIVLPRLVARFGEEAVLCAALGGAALVGIGMVLTAQPVVLLALAALFGFTLGCGMPLSMTLTYSRAPQGRSAEAIGLRQTVNKSIEVTVPIGFGALAAVAGVAPLGIALSVVLAVGAVVIGRDARKRPTSGD
jgi:MFS family permease